MTQDETLSPETLASVKRGIEQAEKGEVHDLGDFTQYLELTRRQNQVMSYLDIEGVRLTLYYHGRGKPNTWYAENIVSGKIYDTKISCQTVNKLSELGLLKVTYGLISIATKP
jgi:hypothetical protein